MLDGGLPAWKEQGLPLDSSPVDEAAVRAPAEAAQQQQAAPQATSSYKAKLQVGWAVSLPGSGDRLYLSFLLSTIAFVDPMAC